MTPNNQKNLLSTSLRLGPVELNVQSLARMRQFYEEVVDLKVFEETPQRVVLGKKELSLLVLHSQPAFKKAHPFHAGLYHFAILFSSRTELAKTIERILSKSAHSFSGSADHLVSEAFYFSDPEGNGIELYFDREATSWQWQNNQVQMTSIYLDPLQYIRQHGESASDNDSAQMGHVHLKVGDIAQAKEFYVEVLGFDITAQLPGALFVSVGGYHHHLGLNTWESQGSPIRPESLGLKSLEIVLPANEDLRSLKERLQVNEIDFTEEENKITLHDPWQNRVIVRS